MDAEVRMLKPLSVFLGATVGLDHMAAALTRIVGHPLLKEERDVGIIYRTVALCIELSLFDEHGLDDDCGIPFTEFGYQLQFVPAQEGMETAGFASLYEGVAVFLASKLSAEVGCRAIVVENLQRIAMSFGPSASG